MWNPGLALALYALFRRTISAMKRKEDKVLAYLHGCLFGICAHYAHYCLSVLIRLCPSLLFLSHAIFVIPCRILIAHILWVLF